MPVSSRPSVVCYSLVENRMRIQALGMPARIQSWAESSELMEIQDSEMRSSSTLMILSQAKLVFLTEITQPVWTLDSKIYKEITQPVHNPDPKIYPSKNK